MIYNRKNKVRNFAQYTQTILDSNRIYYILAFILGLICSFGQPPFNYLISSLLALGLFFHFLLNLNKNISKFWFSYGFGYGYCVYSVHWFSESLLAYGDALLWLMPFGLLLMPAFFALYFALAGFLIAKYSYKNIFSIALIWLSIELVRSYVYIEFPWLLIGYIWSGSEIISQNVSIFSIWGLSFLTIIWVCSIMDSINILISKNKKLNQFPMIFLSVIIFAFCYIYGDFHLDAATIEQNARIRVIQPNIDHNIDARMQNSYKNLINSMDLSQTNNDVNYVIWPEGTNEYHLDQNLMNLIKHASPRNGVLIFNSSRVQNLLKKHWNSLFVINREGEIIDYYDKIRLVPLGEFIPFKLRELFPFINKITPGSVDFSPGNYTKIVKTKEAFLPNICYEAVFPGGSSETFTWIVNLTNDGWFGNGIGPYQHLAMAKFRAIEQGVPMVRAALTGISAVIDSFGRIKHYIPLHKLGVIEAQLPSYVSNFTYYHLYENYMVAILILIIYCLEFLIIKIRTR